MLILSKRYLIDAQNWNRNLDISGRVRDKNKGRNAGNNSCN